MPTSIQLVVNEKGIIDVYRMDMGIGSVIGFLPFQARDFHDVVDDLLRILREEWLVDEQVGTRQMVDIIQALQLLNSQLV